MDAQQESVADHDAFAALRAQLIDRLAEKKVNYFAQHEPWYDYAKADLADRFQLFLGNYDLTPADELTRVAERVLIGHPDDYGQLIREVRDELPGANKDLIVAGLRLGWHREEPGHPVLPDPAFLAADNYGRAVEDTLSIFACVRDNPRRVLANLPARDLDFFDSLPERFTVYRGCRGVSPAMASMGICWTTRRATAEWFARHVEQSGLPILVSSEISKAEVITVFASQREVVCRPASFEQLECREISVSCLPTWGDESL